MSNAVVATKPVEVAFKPFGAEDEIKLTVAIVQRLCASKTKKGETCSDDDALKFMMMCRSSRLNPFAGDAYLVGYDTQDGPKFSLITAHQAFLKRAEMHPEYNGMESGLILGESEQCPACAGKCIIDLKRCPICDGRGGNDEIVGDIPPVGKTVIGGWATVFFKSRNHPMKKRVSLRVFNKGFGLWNTNAPGMIVKCFDIHTEVLTTLGFEKFSKAEGKILQVGNGELGHSFGLSLTDAVPFVQKYGGDMIRYESDDINFCVTPNHDMVTTAQTGSVTSKIEAGLMFEQARLRPKFWIPRIVKNGNSDGPLTDRQIKLAAAFIADGSKHLGTNKRQFRVEVSRERKVEFLDDLGGYEHRYIRECAGDEAVTDTRTITTKKNKTAFYFLADEIECIVNDEKTTNHEAILSMSERQAKLFVDTLVFFDGHTDKTTGVRRFYSSRQDVVRAFELAAVQAGYSVSNRKERESDISTKPGYCLTISERDNIPVRRVGRELEGRSKPGADTHNNYPSLEKIPNWAMDSNGEVWCVVVPTGSIVVRRKGFSFICGNCAECDSLRSSFPTMLGGFYLREEIDEPKLEVLPPRPNRPPVIEAESTASPAPDLNAAPAATNAPQPQQQQQRPPADRRQPTGTGGQQQRAPGGTAGTGVSAQPSEDDPRLLADWCVANRISEEALCTWACGKYRISPCSTINEMWEIAPRRVSLIFAQREELKADIEASMPN